MIRSIQINEEIQKLLDLMKSGECKTALEIGAYECGTAIYMSQTMGPGGLVVSVDLPEEKGGTKREHENDARALVGSERFKLVRGDSAAYETLEAVKKALGGRVVDVLFIDAEHTEAAASNDYNVYKGLVRKGGIIAFHDIALPQLWPFWNRLRGAQPPPTSYEFIANHHQVGCGIGVLLAGY